MRGHLTLLGILYAQNAMKTQAKKHRGQGQYWAGKTQGARRWSVFSSGNQDAGFKTPVGLEAVKAESTVSDLVVVYGVHPTIIH
jgi:hypothetical protein